MDKIKKLLEIDFDAVVKEVNYKDGIIAIAFYFFYMLLIYLFGLLMFKTSLFKLFGRYFTNKTFYLLIFYLPITFLILFSVFIVVKVREQKLESIGLKFDNTIKSVILGILFSLPFILPKIIFYISKSKKISLNYIDLIWLFLYYFIHIALVEEVTFRGFIQTRIQGVIRNKWLSIIVVGLMFGLMHIPFQMIKANMGLLKFVIHDSVHLINTSWIHIYLVYLYTRDNNILAPVVTHTLINFIPTIFV